MWKWLGPALLALVASCEETATEAPPLTDIWSTLPVLEPTRYLEWSSHERGKDSFPEFPHGNKDFNNFLAVCGPRPELPWQRVDSVGPCEPPLQGYLIAAEDTGPGVIGRMYFTAGPVAPPSRATFGDERIRIYVDDLEQPLYETTFANWRAGNMPGFRAPLARYTSGAIVSYRPIAYQSKLRILLDGLRPDSMYYYHISARGNLTRPAPSADAVEFMASAAASFSGQALRRVSFVDKDFEVRAGESVDVLDMDRAGTIQLLSIGASMSDAKAAAETRLTITWDGAAEPAIDVPLSWMFAARHEQKNFRNLPLQVEVRDGRTMFTLGLPMPFERRVRVALRNTGAAPRTLRARIEGAHQLPAGPFGRLHARWTEATGPFTPAQRFSAVKLDGPGKFVGVIMYMEGSGKADHQTPHPVSFLEGDATLRVDGRELQGTGTEDYFNSGFYFQDGPFESPFGGLVVLAADLVAGTGRVTVIRWHVLEDAVDFEREFELEFEYGAYEPLAARYYGALSFFYAR